MAATVRLVAKFRYNSLWNFQKSGKLKVLYKAFLKILEKNTFTTNIVYTGGSTNEYRKSEENVAGPSSTPQRCGSA